MHKTIPHFLIFAACGLLACGDKEDEGSDSGTPVTSQARAGQDDGSNNDNLPGSEGEGEGEGEGEYDANGDDDGDGFTNGEEEDAGTNPDYAPSRPYEGGYNVGFCDTPPSPTGPTMAETYTTDDGTVYNWQVYQNGDVLENLALTDQYGEAVELHSFCGKHVIIAMSAGWCGPCRSLAAEVQAIQDEYRDDGVQFIEIITGDNDNGTPSQAFLQQWATEYGFTDIPVLSGGELYDYDAEEYNFDAPSFTFEMDGYIPTIYQIDLTATVVSADENNHDPSNWVE